MFIVAGLVERAGDQLYNAAVLIDPRGQILLVHRKINELDIAHDLYAIGDRLAVAHTELGTLGISICADNFPNSLAIGHVLARMGAQLLLSPSAWAVDADYDNLAEPYGERWRRAYGELGRLYDLPVIGVSNVGWLTDGPWKGRKAIGCSLATNNRGEILAEGPTANRPKLIVVDVEPRTASYRNPNRRRPGGPRLRWTLAIAQLPARNGSRCYRTILTTHSPAQQRLQRDRDASLR